MAMERNRLATATKQRRETYFEIFRLMLRNIQRLRFNWLGRQKCKEFNLSFYIKQKTVGHLLENR
jgi:hypothetical protein